VVQRTAFCALVLLLAVPACRRNETREEKKPPDGPGAGERGPAPVAKASGPPRMNADAPEIAGKDLDGKAFKLSDYRGKVVLLDFWGHW
jgi:hypothetical protein